MSVIRARGVLVQMGADGAEVSEVFRYLQKHAHDEYTGGMHTNGGCCADYCDYGCSLCVAFHRMCDAIVRFGR